IREFLQFHVDNSSKGVLAASTKLRTLVAIRSILKAAYERRLISSMPLMPRVRQVDQPRPYFTREEYRRLRVTALLLARQARGQGDSPGYARWMEMSDF